MGWVQGKGREDGKYFTLEIVAERCPVIRGEVPAGDDVDPRLLQSRDEVLSPEVRLLCKHWFKDPVDLCQLVLGAHAIRRRFKHPPFQLPLQSCNPDHEEFIEVVGEDGDELDPFDERVDRGTGFRQDPPVEFEPGEFAVDEEGGGIRPVISGITRLPGITRLFLPAIPTRHPLHQVSHTIGEGKFKTMGESRGKTSLPDRTGANTLLQGPGAPPDSSIVFPHFTLPARQQQIMRRERWRNNRCIPMLKNARPPPYQTILVVI